MRFLFLIMVGPYNSDTAFSGKYAEESLFLIEAGLCEVRIGAEETGGHRALRTIDCKRRMLIFQISVVRLPTCDISIMIVNKCVARMRRYL
jgi:hypothetical protein